MYTHFYNLTAKPFENSPDPQFLFLSKQHREVLSSLVYGIESAKGFILVAGGIGTGKTTLVRSLLQEIDSNHIIINIVNPKISFNEIFDHLAQKLEISIAGKNRLESIDALRGRLEALNEQGTRVVILIDEAHLLSDESLEEIRLISNIESNKNKLIQIVLLGQNEIYPLLDRAEQKPLKQRIVINRQLTPLDPKESTKYIVHRLRVAGRTQPLFKKNALSLICNASQGTPRLINQICDNALLIGYAMESELIDTKIIKEVLSDMETVAKKPPVYSSGFFRGGVIGGVLVALAAYYFMEYRHPGENRAAEPIARVAPPSSPETGEQSPQNTPVAGSEDVSRQLERIRHLFRQDASAGVITHGARTGRTVSVQQSELLSTIAKTEYGEVTDTIIDLIHMANPGITNIHHIFSGQQITLPEITRQSLISETAEGAYLIHYASFYSHDIAGKATQRLLDLGSKAFIDSALQGENRVHRIYIGPFPEKATAEAALKTIYLHNLTFLNTDQVP